MTKTMLAATAAVAFAAAAAVVGITTSRGAGEGAAPAATATPTVSASPAVSATAPTAAAIAWGEAVNGLRLGLSPERAEVAAGEAIPLVVYFKNAGTGSLILGPPTIQVALDGASIRVDLPPGQLAAYSTLAAGEERAARFAVGPMIPVAPPEGSGGPAAVIGERALAPGQYSVSVSCRDMWSRGYYKKAAQWEGEARSGPVTVEVAGPASGNVSPAASPAASPAPAATNAPGAVLTLEEAQALAVGRWGRGQYRGQEREFPVHVRPAESELLGRIAAGWQLFQVTVSLPVGERGPAGVPPPAAFYALAARERDPAFLDTDEAAIQFLSGLERSVGDEEAARDLVRAFGELRAYGLLPPGQESHVIPPAKGRFTVAREGNGWAVGCAFRWPQFGGVSRYRFRVGSDGRLELLDREGLQDDFPQPG